MESVFFTFILLSLFAVYSSHLGFTDWDEVVVTREGMSTILVCTDTTIRSAVAFNWWMKSPGAQNWKLVYTANERMGFSSVTSKASMQLKDSNFYNTGVFSVVFSPQMEDNGLYLCKIRQRGGTIMKRIILLAILKVTVIPTPTIPQSSTLQLIASVNPDFAVLRITWATPHGLSMRTENIPNTGTVAKLPLVQITDSGAYNCTVHLLDNSSKDLYDFNVDVNVDADKVASFTNTTYGTKISTATQDQKSLHLSCPIVKGDYVTLYWQPPDTKRSSIMLVHQYDRWRGTTLLTKRNKLQLAGPPYNAEAGNFSFLLTPGIKDGGLYICNVYQDEAIFSQQTVLSVMKVSTRRSSSKLLLTCQYSELSHIKSARWEYQNYTLTMRSQGPGTINTEVPLPITSDTTGNYTCTLKLKNGHTFRASHAVILPAKDESNDIVNVSMLPSLSALLLLVPLVAAGVGVLLWRQKHISDRGIEQSLSVHSSETENIYENPEDTRQAPPQGSVYMVLKPRGEDDVYKELDQ